MTLVLALVMHAQLRRHQGLDTFLGMADLQWAFDVADIPGMLLNLHAAGVSGEDWLLMDDILSQDIQRVTVHGITSSTFKLRCGTAQGRRFSVHVYNGLLRWLYDEVQAAV